MPRVSRPTQNREDELRREGYQAIAGVDEAGRGPLAGPVVAAAVLLPDELEPNLAGGLHDSKLLTPATREHLYRLIVFNAVSYSVGSASALEIDELNILQATMLAMKRAIERLEPSPGYVLVDGNRMPPILQDGEAIVKGDRKSVSIAAASIIAKVTRDRLMDGYHRQFPQYGFDQHKGYPTPYHQAALRVFGACRIHRTSFKGVTEHILAPVQSQEFTSLYKQLAKKHTVDSLTALLDEIIRQRRRLPGDEFTVLHDRVERLLTETRARTVDTGFTRQEEGLEAEESAARYLLRNGYTVWERNYRSSGGEIDIVANRENTIIFAEVRFRRDVEYGQPWETISIRKQNALFRTAERYLQDRSLTDGWDVRFDVISITADESGERHIDHFEDAFRPGL